MTVLAGGGAESAAAAPNRSPRQTVARATHDETGEQPDTPRSEEHTSELQSRRDLVCRLLLEKKKNTTNRISCETSVTVIVQNFIRGIRVWNSEKPARYCEC